MVVASENVSTVNAGYKNIVGNRVQCSYIWKKFNGINTNDSLNRARVLITGVLITGIYCTRFIL